MEHFLNASLTTPKDLMPAPSSKLRQLKWWLLVALNILFLLVGQTAATLLGRFYYDQGGNSKWLSTLVQTALFPLLYIPLIFLPAASSSSSSFNTIAGPSTVKLALVYTALGLIIAADNLMYSYGLLYLPVSTYSLICASQLAFNAIFSYFLNSQKFTALILNSVILLSFSSALLGIDEHESSGDPAGIPRGKFILGFILTVGASATYSLILSLMQLTFQKVIQKETFVVVLEMQIYTAFVASCASIVGLFASGEWKGLADEYEGFSKGKAAYVMAVVGVGVAWQVASVGVVGLIFMVSSLFSNAISTLALPIVPVFAVIFFHDDMNGVKVMAMLIAIWGFLSYLYQNYIDDSTTRMAVRDERESFDSSAA